MRYKEIKIEPIFRNIERTDYRDVFTLTSYIAIDTKRKWYLHSGFFSGMYGITNYETDEFVCALYKNGDIDSVGIDAVNIKDLSAIKRLYDSAIKLGAIK